MNYEPLFRGVPEEQEEVPEGCFDHMVVTPSDSNTPR